MEKPLTVTELNTTAKELLEAALGRVWVLGEISNWRGPASSGHVFFGLKDEGARVDAVLWRSTLVRQQAGVQFADGLAVLASGQLTVYPPTGKYQLVVEKLVPQGLGAAEEALRRLKEKLLKQGYFTQDRKRPLPAFPRRIAVVTSKSGAAVRDVLQVVAQRWQLVDIIVCDVRVQGQGAAAEIAAAIHRLSSLAETLSLDAIIVGRGGGSSDDLTAFNDEGVADAIFRSSVPVVSAVGHEIDVTVADLVADRRAVTPTEAAVMCTPDGLGIAEFLGSSASRLAEALRRTAAQARERVDSLASRRVFRNPLEPIRNRERQLDETATRLRTVIRRRCDSINEQVNLRSAKLDSLSPLHVLGRGYSLTESNGELVRDAADLQVGDSLDIRLHRGRVRSVVTEVTPDE